MLSKHEQIPPQRHHMMPQGPQGPKFGPQPQQADSSKCECKGPWQARRACRMQKHGLQHPSFSSRLFYNTGLIERLRPRQDGFTSTFQEKLFKDTWRLRLAEETQYTTLTSKSKLWSNLKTACHHIFAVARPRHWAGRHCHGF